MGRSDSSKDIASGVSKLSINPNAKTPRAGASAKKKAPVADSWEDEDVDDVESEEASRPSTRGVDEDIDATGTQAPPPTPMSPNYNTSSRSPGPASTTTPTYLPYDQADGSGDSAGSRARPEKTDAVARRMIASALGMKVPKLTEEQRAYDKAMREKERKRREEEREIKKKEEEAAEKAKAAVWGD